MLFQVVEENGQKKIQPLTADTGTGAPVGSIIVVCSNILPSGYLGLGVQYDITNYPALYQVLGTDTTPTASALGLPTLSSGQYAIKATSGLTENQQENVLNTINENNSYSTEEHPTGRKWIDGKPIYRIVLTTTSQINADDVSFGGLQTIISNLNIDTAIYAGGIDNTNRKSFRALLFSSTSGFLPLGSGLAPNSKIIFEYTKTTDN